MSDEEEEFDRVLEEYEDEKRREEEEEEEQRQKEEEDARRADPPVFVTPERALKRYDAGSPQWYDNQYTVQRMRRQRSDEYKKRQLEYYHANSDKYNEQRKARRQEALQEMKTLGLPVTETKEGLLTMKVGRPCVPPEAMLVPLSMIKPIEMGSMVLLGDPDMLKNIRDYVDVPEKADTVFDLQGYLQIKQILISKSPLKWPMFTQGAWDELAVKTRMQYVGNARLSMSNEVVDYVKAYPELAKTLFYYNPNEDAWIDKLNKKQAKDSDDEEDEGVEQKVVPASGRERVGKDKTGNFTQNPLRIVQFMVEVNMDPWKVVLGTCETTQANNKASALASCCYAYLKFLYNEKKYDTELFRKVLYWSFIFARYTFVARKQTQDRHASQLTSEEKVKNTEKWDVWQERVMWYLSQYFIIGPGDKVEIRTKAKGYKPYFPLPGGMQHRMRVKKTTLDDGTKHTFEPELLPWWKPDYNDKRRLANTDGRPNLRELRDCAMLAVYAFLAPIRLDWATVVLMNRSDLDKYKEKKADAEKAKIVAGQVTKKRGPNNKNIVEVDDVKNPKEIVRAYFGKMKNIKAFAEKPVPKDMDKGVKESDHNPKHPTLVRNILLAFLKERVDKEFQSECLFPFSTEKGDELRVDDEGKTQCFENNSFGERLANLSHLLTGKNFTETLMRRSFISWFWRQKGNDALNEQHWKRLLPNIHQNSKSANLGYIKEYNEEIHKEVEKYRELHKIKAGGAVPPDVIEKIRNAQQLKVLEREGMLETAANFNPEEDKDDEKMRKKVQEELKDAIKEQAETKKEIQEEKKKIDEVIELRRQSSRLRGLAPEAKEPQAKPKPQVKPQVKPQAGKKPQVEEEEEEAPPPPPKKQPKKAPPIQKPKQPPVQEPQAPQRKSGRVRSEFFPKD